MSKLTAFLLVGLMLPFALKAENLIKNGDAETDIENWQSEQVQLVTENAHSGQKCFKTMNTVVGTAIIPIDETKTYKYSIWIKSADNKQTDIYLAFMPLDAEKAQINSQELTPIDESETELAEACKPEDIIIKVTDASKWKISDKFNVIAFNTLDDYKDLPNRNISPIITAIEKNNNIWTLTLENPCAKAYPAGTKIRQHRYGCTYMYPATLSKFNSREWQELSAEIKGISKSGQGGREFWAGTKFVKVVFLALDGGTIYFDDWKLEELN